MWPKVFIVIDNWNSLRHTRECLQSLRRISYPQYQVIVVDNGSERDEADQIEKEFGTYVHLVKNDRNVGPAEGWNIGIRHALQDDARYILVLHNDTVVDPDFLSALVEAGESHGTIGILNPVMYDYDSPDEICFSGQDMNWWRLGVTVRFDLTEDELIDIGIAHSAAVLIKRETIERVGLFSGQYFRHFDREDYSIRASRAGTRIVCVPKSRIWHKGAAAVAVTPTDINTYYALRSKLLFWRQHASRPQLLSSVLWLMFVHAPTAFAKWVMHSRDLNQAVAFIQGMAAGLTENLGH